MARTTVFAVAAIITAWAGEPSGLPAQDRTAVLAALEQRALTGIPRHLDHDEGEALQQAVMAALTANPNDGELAWAAVRASFAIVPHVSPVIFDSMPTISVEMRSPFTLPWKITADATIEASLDGSDWRNAVDVPLAEGQTSIPVDKLFPPASRPGFHVVRLRAALRFTGAPGALSGRDIRELPPVSYGVTGSSNAGQRVAALLNSALRANASDFDRSLPSVPLGTWLATIARTPGSPMFWTADWCEDRAGDDDEREASICARAVLGSSPDGGHAGVWVKVATVDSAGSKPTWTAVAPTLEGVELNSGVARSSGDLVMLPSALRSNLNQWPHATLAVDPQTITVSPQTPKPGEPVTIAIEGRNTGTSDLIGMTIDVVVADSTEGPALAHRRFVRSISAGESVTVKTEASFPRGYGVVSVLAVAAAHGGLQTMMTDDSNPSRAVWRVVRPELAPAGFVERMGAAIGCKPTCGPGR